jgi:hypothetical protein
MYNSSFLTSLVTIFHTGGKYELQDLNHNTRSCNNLQKENLSLFEILALVPLACFLPQWNGAVSLCRLKTSINLSQFAALKLMACMDDGIRIPTISSGRSSCCL